MPLKKKFSNHNNKKSYNCFIIYTDCDVPWKKHILQLNGLTNTSHRFAILRIQ